jgi:hypothetical protein
MFGDHERLMSLSAFQSAIADLVARPDRCIAVRENGAILDEYDLSPLERRRIIEIVSHPGMSHNCTLYRANRLTPIARSLPETCSALGARLGEELDAFWRLEPDTELQFKREATRFASFLIRRIERGEIADPILEECLARELQALGASFGYDPHP